MRCSDGQCLRNARKKYLHLEEIMCLLLYGMLMVHFNWLSQSCWFGGLHGPLCLSDDSSATKVVQWFVVSPYVTGHTIDSELLMCRKKPEDGSHGFQVWEVTLFLEKPDAV